MNKTPFIALALAVGMGSATARDSIKLHGTWDFAQGASSPYTTTINLPGSMLTNGLGRDVDTKTEWTGSLYDRSYYHADMYAPYRQQGNIKFPFFLTPDKEYVGTARYRRTVAVPKGWKGQRIVLHLERPHIESTVFFNGKRVGGDMSLSTPHTFDVTKYIKPGKDNIIEIEIYNGIDRVGVGQDSHSITDQTQGNWNGIVGDILLTAMPQALSIERVRVYPDAAGRTLTVKALLNGKPSKNTTVQATATLRGTTTAIKPGTSEMRGDTAVFTINLGPDAPLWSEHNPGAIYNVTVTAGDDSMTTVAGLRDIAAGNREFLLNGKPVYMRGTVENCCFPLTGYPPTDVESWAAIFAKCREYGINHMRFHSYCPPEAAFVAADSLGIYLQPEGPSWPNHGVKLGDGMTIDKYLLDEGRRIIDTYGNHPSFVLMAAGNEPAGHWVEYCADWVRQMKAYDPTKLYSAASVGGGWQWDYGSEYHVKGGGRGLNWSKSAPGATDDYSADIARPRHFDRAPGVTDSDVNTHPILSHEKGQWCAFPDLDEVSQYTGPYKARNFEIFRDLLRNNGMEGMGRKFLMASGRLQALCYKYEIERNLRTPGYPGFQLLALNDYSGQGTALEGVLNVFWREKGYVDAPEWRQWCSPLVVLARIPKFVYTNSETIAAPLEAVNATGSALGASMLSCTVIDDDGNVVWSQLTPVDTVAEGKNQQLGNLNLPLTDLPSPARYTVEASLQNNGREASRNSWQVWVYPDEVSSDVPQGIHVAQSLDATALQVLRNGGKVLLTAAGKVTLGDDVVQHYLPVFWNTSWFKMRPPHTTGASIDTAHPLFRHFPTDDWSNLNWWELLNRAQVMNLHELPADYQPAIQPIDTWHISRKLGMMIEAKVEGGTLLMTTMDIDSKLDRRPVARQMRRAILDYMNSTDFAPTMQLPASTIEHFYTTRTAPIRTYTNDSPDELKPTIK